MQAVAGSKRRPSGDSWSTGDKDHSKKSKREDLHPQRMDAKGKGIAVSNMGALDSAMPSPAGQKKLVIRIRPKLPETFEEDTWAALKRAVNAIQQEIPFPDGLEELYRACENLCQHKMAEKLYIRLHRECEVHIQKELSKLKESARSPQTNFLEGINEVWTKYCQQTLMIRGIFLYLDRTYILQRPELSSIWDMGLSLFRSHIMGDSDIRKRCIDGMLEEIRRERQVDRDILRSLVRMMLDLGIYVSTFELVFLDQTQQFYREEGERMILEMDKQGTGASSLALYLKHAEQRVGQENDRSAPGTGYVDVSTRRRLGQVLEAELVQRHVDILLEKGFDGLVMEKKMDDLQRFYGMLASVDALDRMKKAFSLYIRKNGQVIVNDKERDAQMVGDLLQFKADLDTVLLSAFSRNDGFANAVKESFEYFINQRQNKPAEMIAKFIDQLLRSGKGVTEDEVEATLDRCLVLFRYIQGKDVFEAFYKTDLAKRLLLNRSASVDSEKSMLSKLKAECGSGFTSKLEGMFKDMDVSKDIMASFRDTRHADSLTNIELYVNVLTASYWPTYQAVELTLPSYMSTCLDNFKNFYQGKHSGRRLTWQHSLGHCTVKASFPKGNKELSVSTFQCAVLLLFNSAATLSYQDIKEQTRLEDKELIRVLQSLACGKSRVLAKSPKGRDVNPGTDVFSVNDSFENQLFRIKINAIQAKETVEEQQATTEKVFQDRQYQVDAAIVRIMKTRKTLSHRLLTAELFEQLKFPIKKEDLKKRVESLLDREYIERDKTDQSLYHYVA
ncbi:Cullin [Cladochytrium replicatum]|nr:Cullin [Cladochytrium replicatum]